MTTILTDWYDIPDQDFVNLNFSNPSGYDAAFYGTYTIMGIEGFGGELGDDMLFGSNQSGAWYVVVPPLIGDFGGEALARGSDFHGDSVESFRGLRLSDCVEYRGAGAQNCVGQPASESRSRSSWFGSNFWPGHYAPGFLGYTAKVNANVSTGGNEIFLTSLQSETQTRIADAVAPIQAGVLQGRSPDWSVSNVFYEHYSRKYLGYPYYKWVDVPAVRINSLSTIVSLSSRSDYDWTARLYSFNAQPYGFLTGDSPRYHHNEWVHPHGTFKTLSIPGYAWRGVPDAQIPIDYVEIDQTEHLPLTWMGYTDAEAAKPTEDARWSAWNQRVTSPGSGFIIAMFAGPEYVFTSDPVPWLFVGANGGMEYGGGPGPGLNFSGNKTVQALCYATRKTVNISISVPRVRFELSSSAIPQTITGGFRDDGRQFRRPR